MLNVEKISVFHGDLQALWEVSFKVNKGEIVVVVGSNGAGKSTTLRAVNGLNPPKYGSIEFLGEHIEKLSSSRIVSLGLTYVPEGGKLFPSMSVRENLQLGAYVKRAREKKDETIEMIFQLFPILKERQNQRAGTLSGGERQMLAIARGIMSSPTLLMLDEPSLGLAPKVVRLVFETIERINDGGVTILLVEQNVRQALEIADRAYVLETGKVVLEGTGRELLNNPHVKAAYLGI